MYKANVNKTNVKDKSCNGKYVGDILPYKANGKKISKTNVNGKNSNGNSSGNKTENKTKTNTNGNGKY